LDKSQLVITALQQRIGEIVSNYETQIAVLRAEITTLVQEKEDKVSAVAEYNQELLEQMEAIADLEV
jgi:phage host-nuclease inhibitor protein Gam